MDDYEDERVRKMRQTTTLYQRRYLRGVCPQCAKKVQPGQLYCGAACSARAEAHEPLAPETDEDK